MNGMNIKAKIALTIGVLVSMIVLLVALSVANLQILTATEPDSCRSGIEPGLDMDYGNRRHLHLDRYRYAHQVACIH